MSRYGQVMHKDWHHPIEFAESLRLKTGTCVGVRAILPSDKTGLAHFHEILSEATVYQRYFSFVSLGRRIDPGELARVCSITCREFALVATLKSQTSWEQIIGLAEVVRQDKLDEAECALVVRDYYHNQGLGTHMLPLQSSYERGCQEKILSPPLEGNQGVVTYIQPCLLLRGAFDVAALHRRVVQWRWQPQVILLT